GHLLARTPQLPTGCPRWLRRPGTAREGARPPGSTPDPEARLAGECAPRDTAGIAATCMHAAPERACGPAPPISYPFLQAALRPPPGLLLANQQPPARQPLRCGCDPHRSGCLVVAYPLARPRLAPGLRQVFGAPWRCTPVAGASGGGPIGCSMLDVGCWMFPSWRGDDLGLVFM